MIALTSRDHYLRVETSPRVALLILVMTCGLVVASLGYGVTQRHRAEAAKQEACGARLRELHATNTFLGRYIEPHDRCLALALMKGA